MPRRIAEKKWLQIVSEAKTGKKRTAVGGIVGWMADFQCFNPSLPNPHGITFFMQWQSKDGGRKTISIPSGLKIGEARKYALEYRMKLDNGIDPQEERRTFNEAIKKEQEEEKRIALEKRQTFRVVAEVWFKEMALLGKWKDSEEGEEKERGRARKHVYPAIGDLPITTVDARMVADLLNPLYLAGKSNTVKKLKTFMRQVFRWAVAKGEFGDVHSPINEDLEALTQIAKKTEFEEDSHRAALPFSQMQDFMRALLENASASKMAIAFSILTASRSKQVRCVQWSDIDFKNKVWNVRRETDKMKASNRDRLVYLSPQAIELLNRIPRYSEFIFASQFSGKELTAGALEVVIAKMHKARAKIDGIGWVDPKQLDRTGNPRCITQHGTARASFNTWAQDDYLGNDKKYSQRTIDLCLLHAPRDVYKGAYDRTTLEKSRRELMRDWGRFCFKGISLDDYLPRPE